MTKTILIILTSHDRMGDTDKKTGFWLEELAAPYYAFVDAGVSVTLASPKGGQPPIDPTSLKDESQTDATKRFQADEQANALLASTKKLSEVDASTFDAVFYPGGHGPLWDLADDATSIRIIQTTLASGKAVASVCHGPVVLRNVTDASTGEPIVKGKRVTGFSNSEEKAVGLTEVVPFSLEDEFKKQGGLYSKGDDWEVHVAIDGRLITGQNPGSSEATAQMLLTTLGL
eukprot:TRINITY_DN3652_c0_g1_i1.p1 TRINITY_DN3652_c0_g1~~TRINITY_DN3652_c0_g1_i1.p1  ORF type:complete len:230 (-),score=44.20 TRINITY_DN3652_c0_g1_i1:25-714(-)